MEELLVLLTLWQVVLPIEEAGAEAICGAGQRGLSGFGALGGGG